MFLAYTRSILFAILVVLTLPVFVVALPFALAARMVLSMTSWRRAPALYRVRSARWPRLSAR